MTILDDILERVELEDLQEEAWEEERRRVRGRRSRRPRQAKQRSRRRRLSGLFRRTAPLRQRLLSPRAYRWAGGRHLGPIRTAPCICPTRGTETIRWAQLQLNQTVGSQIPISGLMTHETRAALRRFQSEYGLEVTGILGPDTLAALRMR